MFLVSKIKAFDFICSYFWSFFLSLKAFRVCKLGVFLATWDIFCNASVPGAIVPSVRHSISRHQHLQVVPKRKKKKKREKKGKPATPQPSLDTSIQTLLDFPTSSVGGCVTR